MRGTTHGDSSNRHFLFSDSTTPMTRTTTPQNPKLNVTPRVRLLPAIFALAVTGSAVCPAVEVTFQQYRFTPTSNQAAIDQNTQQPVHSQVQIGEFLFLRRGQAIDMTSVTASGGGAPPATEGVDKLVDGLFTLGNGNASKWFNGNYAPVVFNFGVPTTVDSYTFATANDSLDRTPDRWILEGSNDGTTWVTVDNRNGGDNPGPTTLYTYRPIVGIGGDNLPTINFNTATTQINADGPILEAQPGIVKNTLGTAFKWNVTGTFTDVTLTPPGSSVAATSTSSPIVPPSNGDTFYLLEGTNANGKSSQSLKLRAVPGTSKTARYVRYTGTTLRGNGTLTQIGEIEFFNNGSKVTVNSVSNPGGNTGTSTAETVASINDGNYKTKWLNHNNRPVILDFGTSATFDSYQFSTPNDSNDRDPVRWILETSDDGVNWNLLEAVNQYPMPTDRFTLTGKLPISGTQKWTGAQHGDWDLTSGNWSGAGTYRNDEAVSFDDSGTNRDVWVAEPMSPSFIEVNNSGPGYTFSGESITGLGGLVKRGSGDLTIYTPNSFNGAVYALGGRLVLGNADALGDRSTYNNLELGDGGTLAAQANVSTQRRTVVRESGATVDVSSNMILTKMGSFDLLGTLHKTGDGTLRLQGYKGSVAPAAQDIVVDQGVFEFNHSYYLDPVMPYPTNSLDITVNSLGTLRFAGNAPLGGFHLWTTFAYNQVKLVDGGTFDFTTNLNYIPSGRVSGQGRVVLQGGVMGGGGEFEPVAGNATEQSTITVLPSTNPSQINGGGLMAFNPGNMWFITEPGAVLDISRRISGGYGFVKEGTGEIIISGNTNTYEGKNAVEGVKGTNINAGTLTLSNTAGSATGSSPATIAAGATLQGTGSATGAYTIAGTVAPGAAGSIGTLSLGSVPPVTDPPTPPIVTTISGTYACQIDGATSDKLVVNGDLSLSGTLTVTANAPTEATYVIASYVGNLTGSFATTNLPSGYTLFVNTAAKQIELKQSGGGETYEQWSAGFSDTSAEADIDHDGLPNGIEFVLGSDAQVPSLAKLPTFVRNAANGDFVFTFQRTERSAYLNPVVEYSTSLTGGTWTTFAGAVVSAPVDGSATVTATLPASLAGPGGKLFARLRVTVPVTP